MGYGIHVEKVMDTKEHCDCPLCELGKDSYNRFMRLLVKHKITEHFLSEMPDIPLFTLGVHGLHWFLEDPEAVGVKKGVPVPVLLTLARSFAEALMDRAKEIRDKE